MVEKSTIFSNVYSECRHAFLNACSEAGIEVDSYLCAQSDGFHGEQLFCDVAAIGNPEAKKILFVVSGAHGLEGPPGSAVQTAFLKRLSTEELPDNVRIVLVHAINPYGFSHHRRCDAMNIDPNRNFYDYAAGAAPVNDGYAQLHEILCPDLWTENTQTEIMKAIQDYVRKHNYEALMQAMAAGQYEYKDGLFYGGSKESWSVSTLKKILDKHASKAAEVAYLDFHTGLGAFGEAVHLCFHDDAAAARARARSWYGSDNIDPPANVDGRLERYHGLIYPGIEDYCSHADTTIVCVEFGTCEPFQVAMSLFMEHWLHFKAEKNHPMHADMLDTIIDSFAPRSPDWQSAVLKTGAEIVSNALYGLAREQEKETTNRRKVGEGR